MLYMSVANFPYKQVRYFADSGNAAVPFGVAGVALNAAADVLTPALIVNGDLTESRVTLSAGTYSCYAYSYVNIADAQTACQKLQLGVHVISGAGVVTANAAIKGTNYTAYGQTPLVAATTLAMVNIQIQLLASSPFFVVAAPTSYVLRISYNGMPAAVDSTANFSSLFFTKISDDTNISQIDFQT